MNKCPFCGSPIEENHSFCSTCGSKVNDEKIITEEAHQEENSSYNVDQIINPTTGASSVSSEDDQINIVPELSIDDKKSKSIGLKIIIALIAIALFIAVPLIVIRCVSSSDPYGEPRTFYDNSGTIISFDGNGNCTFDNLNCTYTLKNNIYTIKYEPTGIAYEYTLVQNDVLVAYHKTDGTIFNAKRNGKVTTIWGNSDETYQLFNDGTFTVYVNGQWSAEGNYWLNNGVLVCQHSRSLTIYNTISYQVWYLYSYIDTNGQMYGVALANPEYYREWHNYSN